MRSASGLITLIALLGCIREKSDSSYETGDTAASGEVSDILAELRAIDGVVEPFEAEATTPGTRYYVFGFTQPVDHGDPSGPTFTQWVSLVHRDADAPMILNTRGYGNSWSGLDNELSAALSANRMNVEHRYFMSSRPDSPDWSLLRVSQESDDLHAVVTALKSIYTGAWISTGASKDGETALFYRAAWPDDVEGTVAYVAPIMRAYPDDADGAFGAFFDEIGTAECRERLLALQRALLAERADLVPSLVTEGAAVGETFGWAGADWAFQVSVSELPWSFWQYDTDCEALPADPSDMGVVWPWFLDSVGSPYWYSDNTLNYYSPYFYQVIAELGYPTVPNEGIADLLTVDPDDVAGLLPTTEVPSYDGSVVLSGTAWLAEEGSELLLIYGEVDPWSVRALTLTTATDSYSFTAPGADHGAQIGMLEAADQEIAWDAVSRWAGAPVDTAARERVSPPRGFREALRMRLGD